MSSSVYIHIPFCETICSYCDFCKFYKNTKWVNDYLDALEREIKENYKGEEIRTLYIGGGSPSCLTLDELKKLFDILSLFKLSSDAEITMEANSNDINEDKLKFLQTKINRISIGYQTNNLKYLTLLNRKNNMKIINCVKKYFSNINIDLMYGFAGQTISELKQDLDCVLSLKPSHISIYSLIIEKHTKLFINEYRKEEENDEVLYQFLNKYLRKNGYIHYETSNYSIEGFESKHNLVYWNNEHYYGFGLGASGYINDIRYTNTRNLKKYLSGEFIYEKNKLDKNEMMQNEFILGFRKIKGIDVNLFKEKYDIDILSLKVVKNQIKKDLIIYKDGYLYINPKYIYVANEILVDYMDELE